MKDESLKQFGRFFVFVYGTLKRGHGNHILMQDSVFLGPALTDKKYTMYKSGIPFVSKSPNTTQIIGELYDVVKTTLDDLDMLEGHPTWYKREKVPVTHISRQGEIETVDAWLYFNRNIPHNATIVESGTYGKI